MMTVVLARIGKNQTVKFAFDELAKYLKQMDAELFIDSRVYAERDIERKDIIWVGLDGSVPKSEDDSVYIDVSNGGGIITGSNERSVLLAVYRFLYELGCRWLYPGKDGERIPAVTFEKENINVNVNESPSYRHRGTVLEGEVNCESVINTIDWIPKVGMNSYFIQFQTPGEFFKRWHNDARPSKIPNSPITNDDVDHMILRIEEEIVKRGLAYHDVGHSWNCTAFGLDGTNWGVRKDIPESIAPYLAVLDGERKFWRGQPINSNLCMSQPIVRKKIIDNVLEFYKAHPDVTHMQVWLGDGENNSCECEECSKMRPSDYYVMLLNELDERLTEMKSELKIVFLAYCDLMWAPEKIKFNNPDRFIMLFAPISRNYNNAMADYDKSKKYEAVPYVRNKNEFSNDNGVNLKMLKEWQKHFGGDCLQFDYHLWEPQYLEPGSYRMANVMHRDIVMLSENGINGQFSCQTNQSAFPTGLVAYTMAKTLWNKNISFKEICEEYFTSDFGEYGDAVCAYLSKISELFDIYEFDRHRNQNIILRNCDEARDLINDFLNSVIKKNLKKSPSWKYLMHHAKMCLNYCDMVPACVHRDEKAKEKIAMRQRKYVSEHKHEIWTVFDTKVSRHTTLFGRMINIVSNSNVEIPLSYEAEE